MIYELNVRGFSMHHPAVPPEQRGTVAALAHPAVVDHLRKLGVAAVELMPITAAIDERHLPPLGLRNAWGYNPVVPMALCPERVPGGVAELVATVATLVFAGVAFGAVVLAGSILAVWARRRSRAETARVGGNGPVPVSISARPTEGPQGE